MPRQPPRGSRQPPLSVSELGLGFGTGTSPPVSQAVRSLQKPVNHSSTEPVTTVWAALSCTDSWAASCSGAHSRRMARAPEEIALRIEERLTQNIEDLP